MFELYFCDDNQDLYPLTLPFLSIVRQVSSLNRWALASIKITVGCKRVYPSIRIPCTRSVEHREPCTVVGLLGLFQGRCNEVKIKGTATTQFCGILGLHNAPETLRPSNTSRGGSLVLFFFVSIVVSLLASFHLPCPPYESDGLPP